MKDGFIKTAALSPEIRVADCGYNVDNIINELEWAAENGVKLAVFPELVITGATCGDLFNQSVLIKSASEALNKIRNFTSSLKHEIMSVVGAPIEAGGLLYNACVVIYKGSFLGALPIQNQRKNFTSLNENEILNTRFGLFGKNLVFRANGMLEFSVSVNYMNNASIMLMPYAEEETVVSAEKRVRRIIQCSIDENRAYVCAGAGYGESTTDMIFAGHSLIVEKGRILSESKPFEYKRVVSEIDVLCFTEKEKSKNDNTGEIKFDMDLTSETKLTRHISKTPFIPENKSELEKRCELALKIQANALKKRIEHIGAKRMIIGLSGGLDSTLALIAAVNASDLLKDYSRKNILAITMPCFGTSKRTRSNAEKLADALGVDFKEIDITESVKKHFEDINHDINKRDVVFENAQARERTQVLMDIANSVNGLVIGTGDLSELALGWSTYNGDHMSMYGVNAGIPKTFMRKIVRYYGEKNSDDLLTEVLHDILDTPVSPELLPSGGNENGISQKTEDLIGPYELHDFFIYYALKLRFPPKKILRLAEYAFKGEYTQDTILKWLKNFYKRFFSQQFKRSCMPDGVKIGSVSFSPRKGLDMPSDAVSKVWLNELENI